MLRRLLAIIRKEFIQISRDVRTLAFIILIPTGMLLLFGYAISFDIKDIRFAVCDRDNSRMSREIIQKLQVSGYFTLINYVENEDELDIMLNQGEISLGLVLPIGLQSKIHNQETIAIQSLIDGSDTNLASNIIGYLSAILNIYNKNLLLEVLNRYGLDDSFFNTIDYQPRIWYNPELKSANFLVPGLIGVIMMVVAVLITSLAVVREYEYNTMEQLVVSPLQPAELIIGKLFPYAVIAFFDVIMVLLLGNLVFGVAIKGNLILLLFLSIIFLIGALGVGLFISTIAKTQQVAFMLAMITSMLPSFLLSGFAFPIRNMPKSVQIITYFVPARYFLEISRSIILKGVGIEAFTHNIYFLFAYAFITVTLSSLRWKKRLD